MPERSKKGVLLFIVVAVIMLVVVLATVILRVISSQARLTHHQVSRIQAQYAAKAGVLYALDMLRKNVSGWSPALVTDPPVVKNMCKEVALATSECDCSAPNIFEPDLPISVKCVKITVYHPGAAAPNQGISGTRKVSANAVYTYAP